MKKTILYITITLAALLMPSCEALQNLDCLQEKPIKESTEGFMDSADKIESVLYSSYYQLRRYNCFSRYYHTTIEAMSDYCDALGTTYDAASRYQGLDATLTSRVTDVWNCMYRAIRFCNTILADAPSARNVDAATLDALLGEAKFLRAFTYMFLCQNWGAVPFQTEDNFRADGETNLPRVATATIYGVLADDLEFAANALPDEQALVGRPTKMAANTLLCHLYLLMERWEDARDAAQKVIASEKYSLVEVSISDDFYKLFGPTLITTTEEIFYLKYNNSTDKDMGSCFAAMLHRGGQYFNGSNYYGICSTFDNKQMAEWPNQDLRKAFNLYTVDVEGQEYIYNKKFIDDNCNGDSSNNDYPFYRYADLLLYYAEAAARAAGKPTPDAVEKLNMVHRRAYGKPSTVADPTVDYRLESDSTLEGFLDLVLQERLYETCYEGKRYNDLKRCGKLAERVLYAKDIDVGDGGYWFPIPNEEFLYNKGLSLDNPDDQNPGY